MHRNIEAVSLGYVKMASARYGCNASQTTASFVRSAQRRLSKTLDIERGAFGLSAQGSLERERFRHVSH